MKKVKFRIKRQSDKKSLPRYEDFEVDVEEEDTILDCLNKIKWYNDGSLSLRKNCRNVICGSCSMRVNNRTALACKEHVLDEIKNKEFILIEPMNNMPVIKDLVVDMSPFWQNLEQVDPWIDTSSRKLPEKEFIVSKEQRKLLDEVGNCIMCGACYSDCNAKENYKNFTGPAALAKAYRYTADVRDTKTKERIKKYDSGDNIWSCTHCFNCNFVCPVGVKPMDQIVKLRRLALKQGTSNKDAELHHDIFKETVQNSGILDEFALPVKWAGVNPRRHMDIAQVGLRMALKGKLPSPFHKHIEKLKEIKNLFKNLEGKQ